MIRRLLLILVTACLLAPGALAHERSRSTSSWQIDETGLSGVFLLPARQATIFLSLFPEGTALEEAFRLRLVEGLQVSRDGQACLLDGVPVVRLLPDGRLRGTLRWSCDADATTETAIRVSVFSPFSPNHVHFLSVEGEIANGQEFLLTRQRMTAHISPAGRPAGVLSRVADYFRLGFEHILGGLDHLAFLAALLLIITGWRRLLDVTLGFTLGHSVTLSLAALGLVAPPGAAIEALIGFSILFVAAEAALADRPVGLRLIAGVVLAILVLALVNLVGPSPFPTAMWLGLAAMTAGYLGWLGAGGRARHTAVFMSSGFGLVHGVGFAGILLEIELDRSDLLPALLGFNIGVEAGQIAFVLVLVAGLSVLRRVLPEARLEQGRYLAIALLAGLGIFWMISRALG